MEIVSITAVNEDQLHQAAVVLYESFKRLWPTTCPDVASARQVVDAAMSTDRIGLVAIDDVGQVIGWIGVIPEYDGHAWCIYPLAVREDARERGIGRALVQESERQVRLKGATTMFLGTDDTDGMTSLGNTDLYPNILEHIANIKNYQRHPYEFYQKLGYAIVGVIPDANGQGKPDIYMAKRLLDE